MNDYVIVGYALLDVLDDYAIVGHALLDAPKAYAMIDDEVHKCPMTCVCSYGAVKMRRQHRAMQGRITTNKKPPAERRLFA